MSFYVVYIQSIGSGIGTNSEVLISSNGLVELTALYQMLAQPVSSQSKEECLKSVGTTGGLIQIEPALEPSTLNSNTVKPWRLTKLEQSHPYFFLGPLAHKKIGVLHRRCKSLLFLQN